MPTHQTVPSWASKRVKRPLPEPTTTLPGTPEKVEVLRLRVEAFDRGEICSVFNVLDARWDTPNDHVGRLAFRGENGAVYQGPLVVQDGSPLPFEEEEIETDD